MKVCTKQVRENVISIFQVVLLIKMSFGFVTMRSVCLQQLEIPLIPTSGGSLSIARAEASKQWCFITEICINFSPLLTLSSSKKNTSVTILLDAFKYAEYCWEVIGDFKIVAFLMGLQGGLTKYLVIFAFKTAGTPWHTTSSGIDHSGPSLVWGRTASNGSHCWIPENYPFLRSA